MLKHFRFPAIWALLTFHSLPTFSQAPPVTRARPAISPGHGDSAVFFRQMIGQQPLRPLGATACTDTMGHILTTETNSMLGVDYITQTRDGNILAPGYQWSVAPHFYTFPYLVKYTPQGTILWSKS